MQTILRAITIPLSLNLLTIVAVAILFLAGCTTQQQVANQASLIQEPVLDPKLAQEDFSFPSRPPRLSRGKTVFEQNCASCHTGPMSTAGMRSVRPIDTYLMLTRGDNGHPSFKTLSRDSRWEAVFYARHLAGESQIQTKEIASLFGANCAVCHGSKGFADGPLYTGHASAHELGMAPVKVAFEPPPANFRSYARMYNRTDEELVKFIKEGVYPSAMPSWEGREDKAKGIVFNDVVIEDLVRYVRGFSYENDLEAGGSEEKKPSSKQLSALTPDQGTMMGRND